MSTASSVIKAPFGTSALAPFAAASDRFGLTPFGGVFDALAPFGFGTSMDLGLAPQFSALQAQMNDVLRRTEAMAAIPICDVVENAAAFAVDVELPGFKKEDISVEVAPAAGGSGNLLTISAHHVAREVAEDPTRRWHRRERVERRLSRTLTLPANIDVKAVTSKCDAGMLHITLPKLPASQESGVRKITVS